MTNKNVVITYSETFKDFIDTIKEFTQQGNEVIQFDDNKKVRLGYATPHLDKIWFCTISRRDYINVLKTDPFWSKMYKASEPETFRDKMLDYLNNKF